MARVLLSKTGKMMVDALSSSWSMGVLGREQPPSDDEEAEAPPLAMGVQRSLPASSGEGPGESRLDKLKRAASEKEAPAEVTEPPGKRLAITDSPGRNVRKRPASKAELAKEKKAQAAAAAKEKKEAAARAAEEKEAAAAKAALEEQQRQNANLTECMSFSLPKAVPVKASPA